MNEVVKFLSDLASEFARAEPNPKTGLIEITPEAVKEITDKAAQLANSLTE